MEPVLILFRYLLLPQQFNLDANVQHLFAVEVTEKQGKGKDLLPCEVGEVLFVLLIAHEKLSSDKYLVEKEDGTSESVSLS